MLGSSLVFFWLSLNSFSLVSLGVDPGVDLAPDDVKRGGRIDADAGLASLDPEDADFQRAGGKQLGHGHARVKTGVGVQKEGFAYAAGDDKHVDSFPLGLDSLPGRHNPLWAEPEQR